MTWRECFGVNIVRREPKSKYLYGEFYGSSKNTEILFSLEKGLYSESAYMHVGVVRLHAQFLESGDLLLRIMFKYQPTDVLPDKHDYTEAQWKLFPVLFDMKSGDTRKNVRVFHNAYLRVEEKLLKVPEGAVVNLELVDDGRPFAKEFFVGLEQEQERAMAREGLSEAVAYASNVHLQEAFLGSRAFQDEMNAKGQFFYNHTLGKKAEG